MDERPGKECPGAAQFLDHRRGRDPVLAMAAVFLRHGKAADAEIREFREDIAREGLRGPPRLTLLARRFLGDEPLQTLPKLGYIFRFLREIHGDALPLRPTEPAGTSRRKPEWASSQ